jgi:hypothetical protein
MTMAENKKNVRVSKPSRTPGTTPEVVRGEHGREVRRQHIWKWGDSPVDESQQEEAGWQRFVLKPLETDTTVKTTRDMLSGGVESGLPCACGAMTMWVQTVTALKMMEQAGMEVKEEKHRLTLAHSMVAIMVCPQCEAITQAPESTARVMRQAFLNRRDHE